MILSLVSKNVFDLSINRKMLKLNDILELISDRTTPQHDHGNVQSDTFICVNENLRPRLDLEHLFRVEPSVALLDAFIEPSNNSECLKILSPCNFS